MTRRCRHSRVINLVTLIGQENKSAQLLILLLPMWKKLAVALVLVMATLSDVDAGPLAYGICQTGRNAVAVACY